MAVSIAISIREVSLLNKQNGKTSEILDFVHRQKHIANIYKSGELEEGSTYSILEYMGNDGKQLYSTKAYNLDMILSVGYRVNSIHATRFRQWANSILKKMLDVRNKGVSADIYSGKDLSVLKDAHNTSINVEPIETHLWSKPSHDRWLIIDDFLYHCGHSLKDMGRKLSAITLMGTSPETILGQIR